jgi:hypothetical protein
MKMLLQVIASALIAITSMSCVTGRQHNSYRNYPNEHEFYYYKVNSSSVLIDYVEEINLSAQLGTLADTYLGSRQNYDIQPDKVLLVDIFAEQREFIYSVDLYNAMYINCIIRDEQGIIYGKENELVTGKKSLVDATVQNSIITRVLKRILNEQKKQYRLAMKERRKNEE